MSDGLKEARYNLSVEETIDTIVRYYQMPRDARRQTLYIQGPPGTAKTEAVAQACERLHEVLGEEVKYFSKSAIMDGPEDVKGIPFLNAEARVCDWLISRALPRTGRWIVLVDDLPMAARATQNSYCKIFREGQLEEAEYYPEDTIMFIAAGNRDIDKAGTEKMGSALKTRFANVTVQPTTEEWCDWATSKGLNPFVIAYHRNRPGELYHFEPDAYNFPTLRGWEGVSNIVQYYADVPHQMSALIEGLIGPGHASEFLAFYEVRADLPDLDAILAGENIVPESIDALSVTCSSLVQKVIEMDTKEHAKGTERLVEYALHLLESRKVEFGEVMMRDLLRSKVLGLFAERSKGFDKFSQRSVQYTH